MTEPSLPIDQNNESESDLKAHNVLKWPIIMFMGFLIILIALGVFLMVFSTKLGGVSKATAPKAPISAPTALNTPEAPKPNASPSPAQALTPPPQHHQAQSESVSQQELSLILARLDALERQHAQLKTALNAAIVADSLKKVAETSAPFYPQWLSAREIIGLHPSLELLKPYAQKGVLSRQELIDQFSHYAILAHNAELDQKSNGMGGFLMKGIRHLITIRRVDLLEGNDVDAILARAEKSVKSNDLGAAISALNALSPTSKSAMSAWINAAIERHTLDQALYDLSSSLLGTKVNLGANLGASTPLISQEGRP